MQSLTNITSQQNIDWFMINLAILLMIQGMKKSNLLFILYTFCFFKPQILKFL
jgi:hypothetical protein